MFPVYTEYGRTPIKALLLMWSGVAFSEDYANTSSDIYTLARLTLEQDPGGSLAAVKQLQHATFRSWRGFLLRTCGSAGFSALCSRPPPSKQFRITPAGCYSNPWARKPINVDY